MSMLDNPRVAAAADGLSSADWAESNLTLPDVVLPPGASADLMLALARVLPTGHVLGGPVAESPAAAAEGTVGVVVDPVTAQRARAVSGLILRDEEHTPLAVLTDVEQGSALGVLHGVPQPLRTRESGSAHTIDFDDASVHGRPVLFLHRPATRHDVEAFRGWVGRSERPLVLVPERVSPGHRLPTEVLLMLAEHLVEELGDPRSEVFTVPFEEHGERSDARLAGLIAGRLQAPEAHALTDHSPSSSAAQWQVAWAALESGRAGRAIEGLTPRTREILRAWRPERSARGLVLMFTGLSGSGKSTLARDVSEWLHQNSSRTVTLLDGDRVRQMLSAGLGFDRTSREANVRRIGYVAAEVARHGGIAICSPIAPFATTRSEVRGMVEHVGDFVLVHVSTPLEECERRDLKGLYAKARSGQLADFTGISSPYETPTDADLDIDTSRVSREAAADHVIGFLRAGGWLGDVR
jgi:sulfate adenylyltransferase